MLEIGAAIATATGALKLVEQGLKTGKSVGEMLPSFERFFNAKDDIALAQEEVNNPSFATKTLKNETINAYALRIATANKDAREMEKRLREVFIYSGNEDVYKEMLRHRKAERRRRMEVARAAMARKRFIQDMTLLAAIVVAGIIGFAGLLYMLMN
ncbi:MAG: hypothetical protein CL720_04975 [Chloroflexi bacterium]|jgi:hypothetical protein|nr:hypothetical protein [Chloroflexota bacterium]|tara:strand:+ start:1850 stop:2317 length:468 start_codon:yes stop_codon:yes gene_type:complete